MNANKLAHFKGNNYLQLFFHFNFDISCLWLIKIVPDVVRRGGHSCVTNWRSRGGKSFVRHLILFLIKFIIWNLKIKYLYLKSVDNRAHYYVKFLGRKLL